MFAPHGVMRCKGLVKLSQLTQRSQKEAVHIHVGNKEPAAAMAVGLFFSLVCQQRVKGLLPLLLLLLLLAVSPLLLSVLMLLLLLSLHPSSSSSFLLLLLLLLHPEIHALKEIHGEFKVFGLVGPHHEAGVGLSARKRAGVLSSSSSSSTSTL
jgi:hypothetical protein